MTVPDKMKANAWPIESGIPANRNGEVESTRGEMSCRARWPRPSSSRQGPLGGLQIPVDAVADARGRRLHGVRGQSSNSSPLTPDLLHQIRSGSRRPSIGHGAAGAEPSGLVIPSPSVAGAHGSPPRIVRSMVVRISPLASPSRKLRQARKGAAVAVDAGAGVWLVRAASIPSFARAVAPCGGFHAGRAPLRRTLRT